MTKRNLDGVYFRVMRDGSAVKLFRVQREAKA